MRKLIYLLLPTLLLIGCQTEDLPTAVTDDEALPLKTRHTKTAGQNLCYFVTFEGGADFQPIYPATGGLVPGTPIRFSDEWETFFINVPGLPIPPSGGFVSAIYNLGAEITFERPVASVLFYEITLIPFTVNAYDASNTLVTSASAPASASTPDDITQWFPMSLDAGTNRISHVEVLSSTGLTAIDDLEVCESATEAEIDLQPQNAENAVDLFNLSSQKPVAVAVLSSADLDAQSIDLSGVVLGDPLLMGQVTAASSTVQDVNGDGLPDVIFDFGVARDFRDAGALDGTSTQVRLVASTGSETVFGVDDITIIGGGSQ